jgi:hypothetical protein
MYALTHAVRVSCVYLSLLVYVGPNCCFFLPLFTFVRLLLCLFRDIVQLSSHTGWADLANYVLRCHLCLTVPTDGTCGLLVDGQVLRWFFPCACYYSVLCASE